MKVGRSIGKMIKCLALVAVVLAIGWGGAVAGKGYQIYRAALTQVSLADKVESVRAKADYTRLEDMPETYLDAVVSVEDHRFYHHPGIDPIAIARAILKDIQAGAYVEGGSTITQQLAKNLYFTQEKALTRKAAEVFMAFDLERHYTKDQILELYLNSIYFGNGYYCVKDASEGYFGKEPKQMTDYESTLLAGIPNAPSIYALTNRADLAHQRQKQVLERMVKCGYISLEEAQTYASQQP